MTVARALLVNLERCFGCFACEVACKQERHLSANQRGIELHTLGPATVNGELAMDFVPLCTEYCDLCADRTAAGEEPACVATCPAEALYFTDAPGALRLLRSDRRIAACKLVTQRD
jgi:anaerobic dimethyl sulfoxide reductase subunit B (iron-sulfur subunit)